MRVALVTCLNLDQVDIDDRPLRAALEQRGHEPHTVAWDDPGIDWSSFDAALLRSTWDYHHRREEFLAWTLRAAAHTQLLNSAATARWNSHKFYLRALHAQGVAVLPTEYLVAGTQADLGALLDARGWDAVVIKPAVSADSFGTARAERATLAEGQAHLARLLAQRDMLVQRYLPTVLEPGERCLIAIEGRFTHAVRKRALFQGGRWSGPEGQAVPIAADERDAAEAVLAALPALGVEAPLFARVDLLRDEQGQPLLMELELVEPSLFLDLGPGAAAALVLALEARHARL
jgi:hypothetical protein